MNKFLKTGIGTTLFLTSLTYCGNTELAPVGKAAAEQQSTFFTRLNVVTWTTIEHSANLTIKSPLGRDSGICANNNMHITEPDCATALSDWLC